MSTYTYKTKSLPKNAVQAEVAVEWDHIHATRESVLDQAITTVEVPGFRKGKAPRAMAVARLDSDKVYEQVVRRVLPDIYKEIVEKEALRPATSPAVNLKEAKEGEAWQLTIDIPLVPTVKLKDYKKKITEAHKKAVETAKNDDSKLETVNSEQSVDAAAPEAKKEEKKVTAPLSEIFDILLADAQVEIPELLTQEEVNRRLTRLVEDIKKVGLTPEQYLASKKMTEEELQKQYFKDSEDMYKIEFILAHIADNEKLTVDQAEIAALVGEAKNEREKAIVEQNMTWYETIMRKQKVLDFLNNL